MSQAGPFDIASDQPTGPHAGEPRSAPAIHARPIIATVEDRCPSCKASMAPADLVCLKCGYDLKANVKHAPETGVEEIIVQGERPELIAPGRGSPKALVIMGSLITLAAVIFSSAAQTGRGAGIILGSGLMAAYYIAVQTATGVVALLITAKLAEHRLTNIDLGAARMYLAYSAFALILSAPLGLPPWAAYPLQCALGAVAYFLILAVLFRRPRPILMTIAVTHAILIAVVMLGIQLSAALSSQPAPPAP